MNDFVIAPNIHPVEGHARMDPAATEAWWREHGAERIEVEAGWAAQSPEQILRFEFPAQTSDRFVARHHAAWLSNRMALFVWRRDP